MKTSPENHFVITAISHAYSFDLCDTSMIFHWADFTVDIDFKMATDAIYRLRPKDNSINTNGIPVINNIKMKGIKNAPEK
jgi:hypothetical protein